MSIGTIAMGGLAVGYFAAGGLALAFIHSADAARIQGSGRRRGQRCDCHRRSGQGTVEFPLKNGVSSVEIRQAILDKFPGTWKWLVRLSRHPSAAESAVQTVCLLPFIPSVWNYVPDSPGIIIRIAGESRNSSSCIPWLSR